MAVARSMSAAQRRVVYGFNVALNIVLAVALFALVLWAAGRINGRVDLSSSGVNSLSSRTQKLLRGLDTDIRITGIYSTALEELRRFAEKHRDRVADLLDLYETASGGRIRTEMIDPVKDAAATQSVFARLQDAPKYAAQVVPYKELLEQFPALNQELLGFFQSETDALNQIIAADASLANDVNVSVVLRNFQAMTQSAQQADRKLAESLRSDIPRYGQAVEDMKSFLTDVRGALDAAREWMASRGDETPGASVRLKGFFAAARERYQPIMEKIGETLRASNDLGEVEIEALYNRLAQSETILIESARGAEVVTYEEAFPRRSPDAPPAPDGDPHDFAGEQAISSALLRLTQTERTAVIFTRYAGPSLLTPDFAQFDPRQRRMPEAPFGVLKETLEDENFLVEEWDVAATPEPTIPADAARVVYVVFPPSDPMAQSMGQPSTTPRISADQIAAVTRHVEDSGMAVFLTAPDALRGQFAPAYQFGEYLRKQWGVVPRSKHIAMQFLPHPENPDLAVPSHRQNPLMVDSPGAAPTVQAIGKPLRGYAIGLSGVTPIEIAAGDDAVEGVTAAPVIEQTQSEDAWAITDLTRIDRDFREQLGTRRYDDDIPSPYALAVAAERSDGKRLVVFGGTDFAGNRIANQMVLQQAGSALQLAPAYPGNLDLMINTLHWVTGDAGRIAVGPRGELATIQGLSAGAQQFWNVFLVGIWPGFALLVGAGVWLARRK